MKGGTLICSMASIASAALAVATAGAQRRVYGDQNIRRYIKDYGGSAGYRQRSRGPQAKPRKHPNRLTVSKRVRRKHRRAA